MANRKTRKTKPSRKSVKRPARRTVKRKVAAKKPTRRAKKEVRRTKKPTRRAKKVVRRASKPAAKKPARPAKEARPWAAKHFGLHQEVDVPQLGDSSPRDEVWEIFRTYDRDNSGAIDRGEFARLLEALGQTPNEEELAVALEVVDANHSGKISWPEFSTFWRAR